MRYSWVFAATVAAATIMQMGQALAASTVEDQKVLERYFPRPEVRGIYGAVPGVTSVDPGRLTVTTEEATYSEELARLHDSEREQREQAAQRARDLAAAGQAAQGASAAAAAAAAVAGVAAGGN